MSEPSELSLREIHTYFLRNNYRVTNTALVKYFRRFLTGTEISKFLKNRNLFRLDLIKTFSAILLRLDLKVQLRN